MTSTTSPDECQLSAMGMDEISDPTNFANRYDYEAYLSGFLNCTQETHESERELYVQQLEKRKLIKNMSPMEWTRHSEVVLVPLRYNATVGHTKKLDRLDKSNVIFDSNGKLIQQKKLRPIKRTREISPIGSNTSSVKNMKTKNSLKIEHNDQTTTSQRSGSSTPFDESSELNTLYGVGLEYISLLLKSDPVKKRMIESLQPPEDLTKSLELLEVLTSGKPIINLYPITDKYNTDKLNKNRIRKSINEIRNLQSENTSKETPLMVITLAACILSLQSLTPKHIDKEKDNNKSQVNPFLLKFLRDIHIYTDITDDDLMVCLHGYISLLPLELTSTAATVDSQMFQLQILGQISDPCIDIKEFKSKVRNLAKVREVPKHTAEQNLKKIQETEKGSIGLIRLLQCVMQPPQLGRTVRRVVSKIEKNMKSMLEVRADRSKELDELHVAEIRSIFKLAHRCSDVDTHPVTLSREKFRSIVNPSSMSVDDVDHVFSAHLSEGATEMTLENFINILKSLYPPFSAAPGESVELKRTRGVNESIGAMSKQLRKTAVHRITLPANVTSKIQQVRQTQRMERLTELTGRVKQMQRLKDANKESLSQASSQTVGKSLYKTMLRALLREAKMAEEVDKDQSTPFVGGVKLD